MPIKHSTTAVANTSTIKAADWNADHTLTGGTISDSEHGSRGSALHTDSHARSHVLSSASDHTGTISDSFHGSRGSGLHTDSHARSHDHSVSADGTPIAVAGVPNLPASKITSGRFGMARMPDGTNSYVLTAQGTGVDPVYSAPTGGVGSLSQLTIDVTKNWQGYGITNFGTLAMGADVNLYRGGANILRTDDDFNCSNLTAGEVTATLSNKLITGPNNNQVIIRRDSNNIYICPWGTDTYYNLVVIGGGAPCGLKITGTLIVDTNVLVSNLNADLCDGYHAVDIAGGGVSAGTIVRNWAAPLLFYTQGAYFISTITVNFGSNKSCLITGGFTYIQHQNSANRLYFWIDGYYVGERWLTSPDGNRGALESSWACTLTGSHTIKLSMLVGAGSLSLEFYNLQLFAC